MRSLGVIVQSTIIQKWTMALTGIGLVLFLIGHISGNLLVFMGPEHLNSYAVSLRELLHGSAIWIARIGLLVMFVLHITSAYKLASVNRKARPVKYVKVENRASSMASRSMLYSGTLMLFYVLYHLAHFTWGAAHSEYYHFVDSAGRHDVYKMLVLSFQQPLIAITYIIAMVFVGLHLNHAISSAFQTLGINNPRVTPLVKKGAPALSVALVLAYISIPVAILLGLVTLN